MRYIGDVHGKINSYIRIAGAVSDSIQVGDMGVGFPDADAADADARLRAFQATGRHRFIRGNHDNPNVLETFPGWIPDGQCEGGTMFVGGAESVDAHRRIMGHDMWPDEELSYPALCDIIATYERIKPTIMVTHDCPQTVAGALFDGPSLARKSGLSSTKMALATMFDIHKPDVWIFGHWHHTTGRLIAGTAFLCLGELYYVDI